MKKYEEISVSEMLKLDESEYLVIDIRDEIAFTYGTINNAEIFLKINLMKSYAHYQKISF